MIQKYTVRCIGFLIFALLLATVVISCAEITEEEETETVQVTVEIEPEETETEPTTEDMTADIDANLALLASAYEAVTAANPDGVSEHDFIAANPDAFEKIVAWGEDAVPYLCEIGAGYQEAFHNMRVDPEAYARCVLAYAAAQKIDPATFDRVYRSSDEKHMLCLIPETLWGMGNSYEGILYDTILCDEFGGTITQTQGTSSLAYVDWTADGRYVIVTDRLKDERQLSVTTVFDTVRGEAVGLPFGDIRQQIIEESGYSCKSFNLRYLGTSSANVLRIWIGITPEDGGFVTGYYDYDMISRTVTAMEYAPFDAERGGAAIANALRYHDVGSSFGYLMADYTVHRLEIAVDEDWGRTLYINGNAALHDFLFLDDFRVIDNDYLAVVTGGTDVNSQHLYLFDRTGNLLFETYYLTDKGMIFCGIRAVEEDRILMNGSRGYHGPTLVAPTKEQIMAGKFSDLLYADPISDTMEGGEVTADAFGEVPLYPDRDSVDPDLNPDLVMGGVYALPYLGDGQFGKIEHVETIQTLGNYLTELYGEQTSAADLTDMILPADGDPAAAVDHYLDLLTDGAGDLFSESEIIAKNPDAFDALVSLGTEALSYLQTAAADVPAMIADGESMKRLQRASLAMMAAYTIDPSLYDISVRLPDGKTEVTAKIGTFMALDFGGMRVNAYDRLVMTDLETGEVLAVHGFSEDLINVKLECTPDGRYVVYQWGIGSQHGFTTGGVFDTVWGWLQPFPTKEAFLAVLCPMTPGLTDLNPSDVEGISHTVTEWNADGNAIIYFNFRIGTAILTEGTYRFDPATGAVLDLHTHVHHLNTE